GYGNLADVPKQVGIAVARVEGNPIAGDGHEAATQSGQRVRESGEHAARRIWNCGDDKEASLGAGSRQCPLELQRPLRGVGEKLAGHARLPFVWALKAADA